MSARFPVPNRDNDTEMWLSVSELPLDLKRMLSVQFREFVHYIEDHEPDNVISQSPRLLRFLERCLDQAA